MIVTEAEAETKWCAPNRVVATQTSFDSETGGYTSEVINPQDGAAVTGRVHCIASECMLWQWFDARDGEDPRGFCGFSGLIPQDITP